MNSAASSSKEVPSEELRLPQDFKAKTNVAAKTVRISKNRRSIEIPLMAYASVANVLAMFTESGRLNELPDGATLKLVDEFTGGTASFRADELAAVKEAIETFVVSSTKKKTSSRTKSAPVDRPSGAPPQSKKPSKAADLKVIETTSEETPVFEDAPWTSMLVPEVSDPDFEMQLVKLAVSPKKKKQVYGLATNPDTPKDAIVVPGYEVQANGSHVCWIVVENEKTYHIIKTDFYEGSTHRALSGVVARVKFGVVPNAI